MPGANCRPLRVLRVPRIPFPGRRRGSSWSVGRQRPCGRRSWSSTRERLCPGRRRSSSRQSWASCCLPPERGCAPLEARGVVPTAWSCAQTARGVVPTVWPAGLSRRLRDVAIRERACAGRGGDGAEENRHARSCNRKGRRWRGAEQTGGRGWGQRKGRKEGPRQGEKEYTQTRQPGRLANHEDDGEGVVQIS